MKLQKIFSGFKKQQKFEKLWDAFYSAFEFRFRGESHVILDRLSVRYKERLIKFSQKNPLSALDLGCGHGEMMSLLESCGYEVTGLDKSPVAAKVLRQSGKQVVCTDLFKFLRTTEVASRGFISCLHVVEHLDPKRVFELFVQVHRVLKPGGVFLIETPSLFSLWSGHRQFYLDPTHTCPIHPDYLKFLGEYVGFSSIRPMFFDEVRHPERSRIDSVEGSVLAEEVKKMESWMYGPMDFALWMEK